MTGYVTGWAGSTGTLQFKRISAIFFNASVTFMCRAAGVWRECRPAGCVPRSFRGSPEKILNIALATGGRANQASSRVSVRQVAGFLSGK